jgi:hypothetical protein
MPDRYGEDPAIDLPDAEWSAAQRRNAINASMCCPASARAFASSDIA